MTKVSPQTKYLPLLSLKEIADIVLNPIISSDLRVKVEIAFQNRLQDLDGVAWSRMSLQEREGIIDALMLIERLADDSRI